MFFLKHGVYTSFQLVITCIVIIYHVQIKLQLIFFTFHETYQMLQSSAALAPHNVSTRKIFICLDSEQLNQTFFLFSQSLVT